MKITARANANIALIKYWGKREATLNLPAVGSISLTLAELNTITSVTFSEKLKSDRIRINDMQVQNAPARRVSGFLDLIRRQAHISYKAEVISKNNFPTAAGLASSASAFAALALAASKAAGLNLTHRQLSVLARQGSGSAARSVFSGFVEMHKGVLKDGSDAYAEQIADSSYWDLRLLIAVTSREKKKIASTAGMEFSRATSPYYSAWVETADYDLAEMRLAIQKRDFEKLGELSEYSCLKMHALALSSRPGLLYWNGTTIRLIAFIRELRKKGYPVYFTIDAGPQLKALCEADEAEKIKRALLNFPGVKEVIETGLGQGAKIMSVTDD